MENVHKMIIATWCGGGLLASTCFFLGEQNLALVLLAITAMIVAIIGAFEYRKNNEHMKFTTMVAGASVFLFVLVLVLIKSWSYFFS
ncbi:MAG: hypothetical protein RSD88_07390 [Anaerovoracaceae bacterium]